TLAKLPEVPSYCDMMNHDEMSGGHQDRERTHKIFSVFTPLFHTSAVIQWVTASSSHRWWRSLLH
ncbi:hypothetical protein HispidOSU_025389, partial [Sigmodon hispidus]